MRPGLLLLALFVLACGGPSGAGPAPSSAPPAPPAWPLRGTNASDADAPHRRPIVVKVANDPAARPQSGLADADLVLEIPVEGGLTRYALVFHSKEPSRVGPVRSARQSDLNYLSALKAILAHVGASESVAKLVRDAAKAGSFVDVDEFEHPTAFGRISTRPAPYNAYTDGKTIRDAGGERGRERVDVPALQFDASTGKAAGNAATSLTIPYRGAEQVKYAYDAATGAYHRTQGGGTIDNEGKREVLPENVVVIKTEVKEIPGTADVTGAPSVDFRGTGTGAVVVLRDGKRFDGKWSRAGANDMYRFTDAAGAAIPLKPGLTWIHIVPEDFDLSG
ncbi:MAG TPA: DUF3048 domain-containing protein [Candidatus Limnocylindria bacterium]|jgi:hypothetical protein|nr:DUF3048 domain-containing protein [Candidatus Limnocylindria bacterium]